MNGFGKYFFSNGSKYEGKWKSDIMNGFGRYYKSNGDKYYGYWKDGNFER